MGLFFHSRARRNRRLRQLGAAFAALWLATCVYQTRKPLPDGVSVAGPLRADSEIEFLADLTYQRDGEQVTEHVIFDRVLALIDSADVFLVADMFLFNDEHAGDRPYRPLTTQLTERLIARRLAHVQMPIVFITDPINSFYGAYTTEQMARLDAFGIDVVETRLERLRDSNALYSAAWRIIPAWLGTRGPAFFPHPLSSRGRKVTARSYLKLLNFKANHRKVIVTEDGCLVMSANPHDASSFHSNIAFAARGPICQDILESERGIAAFSGATIPPFAPPSSPPSSPGAGPGVAAQYLTEGQIRTALLEELERSGVGHRIDIAVFYLSDRGIVREMLDAAARGAVIRVVLDPNKDAFGRQKGGVPNRQVARELVRASDGRITVRWYDTHGEQFHTKLAVFTRGDSVSILGGSANFTRRNLGDYNLEVDLRIVASWNAPIVRDVTAYYDRIWFNRAGQFTLGYEVYRDDSWFKRVLYLVQEFTGFSTY